MIKFVWNLPRVCLKCGFNDTKLYRLKIISLLQLLAKSLDQTLSIFFQV